MPGALTEIKDMSPNEDTVRLLKTLLKQAEEGEVRSIVYTLSFDDDCVTHGWSHDKRNSFRRILAEVTILQHELMVNIGFMDGDSVLSKAFEGVD